ncbi:MAG: hypothetical protein KKC84_04925, partial [Candidatus Omnitrophica bacterium]|nr:hypothetical protein [Candidatus Omnitrophota bacterium]
MKRRVELTDNREVQEAQMMPQPQAPFKSSFKSWVRVVAFLILVVFTPQQIAQAAEFDWRVIWRQPFAQPLNLLPNQIPPQLQNLANPNIALAVKNILTQITQQPVTSIKISPTLTISLDKPLKLSKQRIEEIYNWLKERPCGAKALFEYLSFQSVVVSEQDLAVIALTSDIVNGIIKPEGNSEVVKNSLYALSQATQFYGLTLVPVQLDIKSIPLDSANSLTPFIGHFKDDHYMLVTKVSENSVYMVNDHQEEVVSLEKFENDATGYALLPETADSRTYRILNDNEAKAVLGAKTNRRRHVYVGAIFKQPSIKDQLISIGVAAAAVATGAYLGGGLTVSSFVTSFAHAAYTRQLSQAATNIGIHAFKMNPTTAQVFGYAVTNGINAQFTGEKFYFSKAHAQDFADPKNLTQNSFWTQNSRISSLANFGMASLEGAAVGYTSVKLNNWVAKHTKKPTWYNYAARGATQIGAPIAGFAAFNALTSGVGIQHHWQYRDPQTNEIRRTPFAEDDFYSMSFKQRLWQGTRNSFTPDMRNYVLAQGAGAIVENIAMSRLGKSPYSRVLGTSANIGVGAYLGKGWSGVIPGIRDGLINGAISVGLNEVNKKLEDKYNLTPLASAGITYLGSVAAGAAFNYLSGGDLKNYLWDTRDPDNPGGAIIGFGLDYLDFGINPAIRLIKVAEFSGLSGYAARAKKLQQMTGKSWKELVKDGQTTDLLPSFGRSLVDYAQSKLHYSAVDTLSPIARSLTRPFLFVTRDARTQTRTLAGEVRIRQATQPLQQDETSINFDPRIFEQTLENIQNINEEQPAPWNSGPTITGETRPLTEEIAGLSSDTPVNLIRVEKQPTLLGKIISPIWQSKDWGRTDAYEVREYRSKMRPDPILMRGSVIRRNTPLALGQNNALVAQYSDVVMRDERTGRTVSHLLYNPSGVQNAIYNRNSETFLANSTVRGIAMVDGRSQLISSLYEAEVILPSGSDSKPDPEHAFFSDFSYDSVTGTVAGYISFNLNGDSFSASAILPQEWLSTLGNNNATGTYSDYTVRRPGDTARLTTIGKGSGVDFKSILNTEIIGDDTRRSGTKFTQLGNNLPTLEVLRSAGNREELARQLDTDSSFVSAFTNAGFSQEFVNDNLPFLQQAGTKSFHLRSADVRKGGFAVNPYLYGSRFVREGQAAAEYAVWFDGTTEGIGRTMDGDRVQELRLGGWRIDVPEYNVQHSDSQDFILNAQELRDVSVEKGDSTQRFVLGLPEQERSYTPNFYIWVTKGEFSRRALPATSAPAPLEENPNPPVDFTQQISSSVASLAPANQEIITGLFTGVKGDLSPGAEKGDINVRNANFQLFMGSGREALLFDQKYDLTINDPSATDGVALWDMPEDVRFNFMRITKDDNAHLGFRLDGAIAKVYTDTEYRFGTDQQVTAKNALVWSAAGGEAQTQIGNFILDKVKDAESLTVDTLQQMVQENFSSPNTLAGLAQINKNTGEVGFFKLVEENGITGATQHSNDLTPPAQDPETAILYTGKAYAGVLTIDTLSRDQNNFILKGQGQSPLTVHEMAIGMTTRVPEVGEIPGQDWYGKLSEADVNFDLAEGVREEVRARYSNIFGQRLNPGDNIINKQGYIPFQEMAFNFVEKNAQSSITHQGLSILSILGGKAVFRNGSWMPADDGQQTRADWFNPEGSYYLSQARERGQDKEVRVDSLTLFGSKAGDTVVWSEENARYQGTIGYGDDNGISPNRIEGLQVKDNVIFVKSGSNAEWDFINAKYIEDAASGVLPKTAQTDDPALAKRIFDVVDRPVTEMDIHIEGGSAQGKGTLVAGLDFLTPAGALNRNRAQSIVMDRSYGAKLDIHCFDGINGNDVGAEGLEVNQSLWLGKGNYIFDTDAEGRTLIRGGEGISYYAFLDKAQDVILDEGWNQIKSRGIVYIRPLAEGAQLGEGNALPVRAIVGGGSLELWGKKSDGSGELELKGTIPEGTELTINDKGALVASFALQHAVGSVGQRPEGDSSAASPIATFEKEYTVVLGADESGNAIALPAWQTGDSDYLPGHISLGQGRFVTPEEYQAYKALSTQPEIQKYFLGSFEDDARTGFSGIQLASRRVLADQLGVDYLGEAYNFEADAQSDFVVLERARLQYRQDTLQKNLTNLEEGVRSIQYSDAAQYVMLNGSINSVWLALRKGNIDQAEKELGAVYQDLGRYYEIKNQPRSQRALGFATAEPDVTGVRTEVPQTMELPTDLIEVNRVMADSLRVRGYLGNDYDINADAQNEYAQLTTAIESYNEVRREVYLGDIDNAIGMAQGVLNDLHAKAETSGRDRKAYEDVAILYDIDGAARGANFSWMNTDYLFGPQTYDRVREREFLVVDRWTGRLERKDLQDLGLNNDALYEINVRLEAVKEETGRGVPVDSREYQEILLEAQRQALSEVVIKKMPLGALSRYMPIMVVDDAVTTRETATYTGGTLLLAGAVAADVLLWKAPIATTSVGKLLALGGGSVLLSVGGNEVLKYGVTGEILTGPELATVIALSAIPTVGGYLGGVRSVGNAVMRARILRMATSSAASYQVGNLANIVTEGKPLGLGGGLATLGVGALLPAGASAPKAALSFVGKRAIAPIAGRIAGQGAKSFVQTYSAATTLGTYYTGSLAYAITHAALTDSSYRPSSALGALTHNFFSAGGRQIIKGLPNFCISPLVERTTALRKRMSILDQTETEMVLGAFSNHLGIAAAAPGYAYGFAKFYLSTPGLVLNAVTHPLDTLHEFAGMVDIIGRIMGGQATGISPANAGEWGYLFGALRGSGASLRDTGKGLRTLASRKVTTLQAANTTINGVSSIGRLGKTVDFLGRAIETTPNIMYINTGLALGMTLANGGIDQLGRTAKNTAYNFDTVVSSSLGINLFFRGMGVGISRGLGKYQTSRLGTYTASGNQGRLNWKPQAAGLGITAGGAGMYLAGTRINGIKNKIGGNILANAGLIVAGLGLSYALHAHQAGFRNVFARTPWAQGVRSYWTNVALGLPAASAIGYGIEKLIVAPAFSLFDTTVGMSSDNKGEASGWDTYRIASTPNLFGENAGRTYYLFNRETEKYDPHQFLERGDWRSALLTGALLLGATTTTWNYAKLNKRLPFSKSGAQEALGKLKEPFIGNKKLFTQLGEIPFAQGVLSRWKTIGTGMGLLAVNNLPLDSYRESIPLLNAPEARTVLNVAALALVGGSRFLKSNTVRRSRALAGGLGLLALNNVDLLRKVHIFDENNPEWHTGMNIAALAIIAGGIMTPAAAKLAARYPKAQPKFAKVYSAVKTVAVDHGIQGTGRTLLTVIAPLHIAVEGTSWLFKEYVLPSTNTSLGKSFFNNTFAAFWTPESAVKYRGVWNPATKGYLGSFWDLFR